MSQKLLLEEIIQQLVDPKQSLEGPLLRLKIFALQTKNKELEKFVNDEINGYQNNEQIPDYRVSHCRLLVDLKVGYNTTKDCELDVALFPEEIRNVLKNYQLTYSISTIESFIAQQKTASNLGVISDNIGIELHKLFWEAAKNRYQSTGVLPLELVGAKRNLGISALISCISSLRSKLLDFCYIAATEFDYEIDITKFNKEQNLNNQKITNMVQYIITNSGDGNLVNTGNNNQITSTVNISKGDLEALKNKLKELGIDSTDIVDFEEIIYTEPLDATSKNLSHKVIDWVTNICGKSLKGIGSISKGVTTDLLVELIKQYLDIK